MGAVFSYSSKRNQQDAVCVKLSWFVRVVLVCYASFSLNIFCFPFGEGLIQVQTD